MFGFLAPNGAGKTTTVRMLGTLLAPTTGAAAARGADEGSTSGGRPRRPRARPHREPVQRAAPPPGGGRATASC
ncbi:MAG TPA: hypothetical protein VIY52_11495 [Streptosporangiaceae bacterium]